MLKQENTLFGHPKGLFVLFMTEMWERFSYYGMRALLIYYMIKHLMFSQGQASQVYGLYTGMVFFTPILGGILADRYWGQRKSVIIGAALMALGHFVMAFETLFYPALLLLVLGNGAFKPNISTQVGNLYKPGDPKRDRAFSIFYVGVNLGAFFAPLACGTLGELYGWHYGFGVAGVGMLVGLCVYILGGKYLAQDNLHKTAGTARVAEQNIDRKNDKKRIIGLIIVCLVVVLFWAAFEQQGNTLALWIDKDTDRHIFGWEVPATWFQSLNPMFIFILTPLVTAFWARQARQKREPSSLMKMAIGCFFLGAGFLLLASTAISYDADGIPVSMFWLIGFNCIITLGELYLSPVGLSLVTKLAPARMVSMLMGVWFLSSFAGNNLAGFLGTFWDAWPREQFFVVISAMAFFAGILIICLRRFLTQLTESPAMAAPNTENP